MNFTKYTTIGGTVNVESDCGNWMVRFAKGSSNPMYHIFVSGLVAAGHRLYDEDLRHYTIGSIDDLDQPKLEATVS